MHTFMYIENTQTKKKATQMFVLRRDRIRDIWCCSKFFIHCAKSVVKGFVRLA